MTTVMMLSAVVVAVVAAVRSTWSPCGLSMLATITPIGERGRGRRYRSTAGWFVVGAGAGGAALGTMTAVIAAGVRALGLPPTTLGVVGMIAAAVCAGSDAGVRPLQLPVHHRQVNERWLDQYRPWVYGAGFGWQIGTGLATYIMTAGVYLTVVLGALSASPWGALALGSAFGLVRGLAVLLGRNLTTPDALRSFHGRFAAIGPVTKISTVAVEVVVTIALATALWPPAGIVLGGACLAWAGVAAIRRRHAPAGRTGPDPVGGLSRS